MIAAGAVENVSRDRRAPRRSRPGRGSRRRIAPGVLTASCQELHVTIKGMGAHAARPHLSVDPIGVGRPVRQQHLSVRAPLGRLARPRRRHVRLHSGRHERQRHSRAGRADGDDPDAERSGRRAGRGTDHADRPRSFGGQPGHDRRHVPARHRCRGQRPARHRRLRPGRSRGRRPGERRRNPSAQHGRRRLLRLPQSTRPVACCGWASRRPIAPSLPPYPATSISTNARWRSGPSCWRTASSSCPTPSRSNLN